jgi:hypothetical protein
MLLRHACLVMLLGGLLAACGSGGPPRKVHPSTASIQQLAVQADGSWRLTLRIQNYSTFSMHFSRIDAGLSIDGKELGRLEATPDIDIVGNNGDVVEATFRPNAKTTFGTERRLRAEGHDRDERTEGKLQVRDREPAHARTGHSEHLPLNQRAVRSRSLPTAAVPATQEPGRSTRAHWTGDGSRRSLRTCRRSTDHLGAPRAFG